MAERAPESKLQLALIGLREHVNDWILSRLYRRWFAPVPAVVVPDVADPTTGCPAGLRILTIAILPVIFVHAVSASAIYAHAIPVDAVGVDAISLQVFISHSICAYSMHLNAIPSTIRASNSLCHRRHLRRPLRVAFAGIPSPKCHDEVASRELGRPRRTPRRLDALRLLYEAYAVTNAFLMALFDIGWQRWLLNCLEIHPPLWLDRWKLPACGPLKPLAPATLHPSQDALLAVLAAT